MNNELIIKLPSSINHESIKRITILTNENYSIDIDSKLVSNNIYVDECTINLENNRLNIEKFKNYINSLSNKLINCNKIVINISYNYISDDEFQKIINYLSSNQYIIHKLYYLNISNNQLKRVSFELLFNFISKCYMFRILKCDINYISTIEFNELLQNSNIISELKNIIFYSNI